MDYSPPGFSVPEILQGKNTGVGCHALLQGIFPTQGSNLCLLHLLLWPPGSSPLETGQNGPGCISLRRAALAPLRACQAGCAVHADAATRAESFPVSLFCLCFLWVSLGDPPSQGSLRCTLAYLRFPVMWGAGSPGPGLRVSLGLQ